MLARVLTRQSTLAAQRRLLSSEAVPRPEAYSTAIQALHWSMGAGVLGCFGFVQASLWTPKENKKRKGELMFWHKSCGLAVACLFPVRVAARLASRAPALPAGNAVEHFAANASHAALYTFMAVMPATGVAMGLMGGKGLPAFFGSLPPLSGEFGKAYNGKLAGKAYKLHKQVGPFFEYLVPVHIGAVGVHALKGQNILKRIVPGMKP